MAAVYESFVIALAAPVTRHQGGDERVFGGGIDAARARSLLDTLFRIQSADDAIALLESFAEHGQRAEWKQYQAHAGGEWKPGPEDHSVLRKAEFAIANKKKLGARGLLALDAMRSSAIAGWCAAAGLLSAPEALGEVGGELVKETVKAHKSWSDFAEQVRLAYGFTDGEVPPEMASVLQSLLDGEGPWRGLAWPTVRALGSPPKRTRSDDDDADSDDAGDDADSDDDDGDDDEVVDDPSRPLSVVSFALTVDCPGCGESVSFREIGAGETCASCRTRIPLLPADWAYFLKSDFAKLRKGTAGDDPYTNDFGDRFFSRREVRRRDSVLCSCGAKLHTPPQTGEISCGACGVTSIVHAAGEHAHATDRRARFVVETRPRASADRAACAACGGSVPAVSPVVRCESCDNLTFVGGHAQSPRAMLQVLLTW